MKLEMMMSWVNVNDQAKARQFYGDVLGLKQVFAMEGWAEFSQAEGAVSVGLNAMHAAKGEPAQPGATIVFQVDDLDKACADLRRRGVKFEGEVHEVPGVVRIATFRDPFGNPLQLAQSLVG